MNTISTSILRSFTNLASIIAGGACLALLLAACQTPETKVDAAKDNVADANQDLKEVTREMRAQWQEDWLAFKRANDEVVADNERSIMQFRSDVRAVDQRYRGKYTTLVDDIERRNNELRDRVNNYEITGEVKWEEFKKDIKRDMDDLISSRKNVSITNS